MSTSNTPHAEDLVSVGSRVSWSAILAGVAVSLAIQFLLGVVATTVGLAGSDRTEEQVRNNALIIGIASACVALFAGGVVTTQLTAGENKVEAAIYGIVMWATVVAVLAHGAVAGRNAFPGALRDMSVSGHWETAARDAGIPADQIQQWRTKLAENPSAVEGERNEAARRGHWWVFGGVWLSMFCAAGGALVGAGPTFRLVTVRRTTALG
jgi:hypothetical protein